MPPQVTIHAEDDAAIERILNNVRTKSRKEGERLLSASAFHGNKSETWIYLPEGDKWYNLSIESLKRNKNERKLIFYPYNFEDVTQATHYDVHTKEAELNFCTDLKNPTELKQKTFGHLAAVNNAIPSPNYVWVYANSMHFNQPTKYDFRIVHPRGITQFEFKRDNLERALDLYVKLFDTRTITIAVQNSVKHNKDINGSIEEIVNFFNEGMFGYTNMKFFPLKQNFMDDENKAYGSEPSKN